MKSIFKFWWLIALVFIIAGVTVGAVAWGLGADGSYIYIDSDGIHVESFDQDKYITTRESDLAPFTSIQLSTISAEVELIESDHYGFESQLEQSAGELSWSLESGVLSIDTHSSSSFRLPIFNFDFASDTFVKVYYPADAKFDTIDLYSTSGSIRGDAALSATSLSARTISGEIDLATTQTTTASLESTSGSIDYAADSVTPATVRVKTISGDINLDQLSYSDLSAESISGSIAVDATATGPAFLRSISGSVLIDLHDTPPDSICFKASSISGGIFFNDDTIPRFYDFMCHPGSHDLKVETTSGSIRLKTSQ